MKEFLYLSPPTLQKLTPDQRQQRMADYWQKCDPSYWDGDGSETFLDFVKRIGFFHQELIKLEGFIVVVRHRQFFKAYQFFLQQQFKRDTISFIEHLVQEIKPTHVYTHSAHDNHQDHRYFTPLRVIAVPLLSHVIPNVSVESPYTYLKSNTTEKSTLC